MVKEIPLENFRFMVEQTERNFGYTTMQAVDNVWKQYVRNLVFENQFDILGIDAGRIKWSSCFFVDQNNIKGINEQVFDFGLFTDFIIQLKNTDLEAYNHGSNGSYQLFHLLENIYFDLI